MTKSLDEFNFKGLRDFEDKVILIIYPSTDNRILENKLMKAMETFCKSCFKTADLEANIGQSMETVKKDYDELINYLEMNNKEFRGFLDKVKELSQIEKWRIYLWKEKCLYEVLNKMEIRQQFYIANIYIPLKDVPRLTHKLNMMAPPPTLHELPLGKPPTTFNTNSYTGSAQIITNTYGVPRYQEVNPSIFTTVTFPFFFGVMFGDIGHGGLLFGFGLYLVFFNESVKKGSLRLLSELRYMICMMGFFAFYCGWIYNDLIGFNTNFFGSCFDPPMAVDEGDKDTTSQSFSPKPDCVYPFGVDPIWGRAQNNLIFVNSLKMKISVIIAIIHMTMGIVVKAFNSSFFRQKLDFYF